MDTIFAVATASGPAGVAIVRISGPSAHAAARALTQRTLPEMRQAARRVFLTEDGMPIDEGILLLFAEGSSFTGEDIAEFQVHGSPAVLSLLLEVLGRQAVCRLAEPGEFTRRALENGRLDLAQVEGLGELIASETEIQRQQSLKVMRGALSDRAEAWRAQLIEALALLDAAIDFSDDGISEVPVSEVDQLLSGTRAEMLTEIAGSGVAERIHSGFEVAVLGAPNSGKSTIINKLAGREAALTSETAGTTRDIIEVRMDLMGLAVTFLDTAGLRDSDDDIEVRGIALARSRADEADLRVVLIAPGETVESLELNLRHDDILVESKADLRPDQSDSVLKVSGLTGFGVERLIDLVSERLRARAQGASSVIRIRQRKALESAVGHLESARNEVWNGPERIELAAEEVRLSIHGLDSLIGRVDVENVLDVIFSRFCLGK